jgi:hypothetical protein
MGSSPPPSFYGHKFYCHSKTGFVERTNVVDVGPCSDGGGFVCHSLEGWDCEGRVETPRTELPISVVLERRLEVNLCR